VKVSIDGERWSCLGMLEEADYWWKAQINWFQGPRISEKILRGVDGNMAYEEEE
jgi:hypothetical protein